MELSGIPKFGGPSLDQAHCTWESLVASRAKNSKQLGFGPPGHQHRTKFSGSLRFGHFKGLQLANAMQKRLSWSHLLVTSGGAVQRANAGGGAFVPFLYRGRNLSSRKKTATCNMANIDKMTSLLSESPVEQNNIPLLAHHVYVSAIVPRLDLNWLFGVATSFHLALKTIRNELGDPETINPHQQFPPQKQKSAQRAGC